MIWQIHMYTYYIHNMGPQAMVTATDKVEKNYLAGPRSMKKKITRAGLL